MTGTGGSTARNVGIVGAIVGLVAAGVAGERYLIKKARNDPEDPYIDEPFGTLPSDDTSMVDTADGVSLYVEATGPKDAPVTVVFVHGYCLDMGTFHFQRKALTGMNVRAIYYDQPGHGRSAALPHREYDIAGLADALYAVIDSTVQSSRVVLVGHSMGGMTIMALARRHPELFADRVAGVALLSTTAGGLDQVSFGMPKALRRVRSTALPVLGRMATWTPGAINGLRKLTGDLAWLLTRRYGFISERPSPSLVSHVERMNTGTPIQTVVGLVRALLDHDEHDTLPVFRELPTIIVSGEHDQFAPLSHAEILAAELPQAMFKVVADSAHLTLLEHPDEVTDPLVELVTRVERDGADSAPSDDGSAPDRPTGLSRLWRRGNS